MSQTPLWTLKKEVFLPIDLFFFSSLVGNELRRLDLQGGNDLIHPNEILSRLKIFVEAEISPTVATTTTPSKKANR